MSQPQQRGGGGGGGGKGRGGEQGRGGGAPRGGGGGAPRAPRPAAPTPRPAAPTPRPAAPTPRPAAPAGPEPVQPQPRQWGAPRPARPPIPAAQQPIQPPRQPAPAPARAPAPVPAPAPALAQTPAPAPQPARAAAPVQTPARVRVAELDEEAKQFKTVARPGPGTNGKVVQLRANFFPLKSETLKETAWHYDVSVEPEIKVKKIVRLVVEEAARQHFRGVAYAHDGLKNLYTARSLALSEDSLAADVEIAPEPGTEDKPRKVHVTIRLAAQVSLHEAIGSYLRGRSRDIPQAALQALNVVMSHRLASRYLTIGRNIYFPETAKPLGGGADVYLGNFQAVKVTQLGLALNVDVAATAYVRPGPLIAYIKERVTHPSLLAERMGREVTGLRIQIKHRRDIRRKYRIIGTGRPPARQEFTLDDGTTTTVQKYFLDTYERTLAHPEFPCVNVGKPGKDIWLPAEVCDVLRQPFNKEMTTEQRTKMIIATTQSPQEKMGAINSSVPLRELPRDEVVREFGLELYTQMVQVTGRVLPSPTLMYQGQAGNVRPNNGQWDMKDRRFISARSIGKWLCINFTTERTLPRARLQEFVGRLAKSLADKGIRNPGAPPVLHADPRTVEATLVGQVQGKGIDLVLCVLESARSLGYDVIKRLCETRLGAVSQCLDACKVADMKVSGGAYQVNVAMKINTKLGGRNTEIVPTEPLPVVSAAPTLVLGADVTHPPPGDVTRPSIAAVVGSLDISCVQYAGVMRAQEHRREDIVDLKGMVIELLRHFSAATGKQAQRIIMYRDGVGESMVDQIARTELQALRNAYKALYGRVCPVAFINVQKRNKCKLFPNRKGDGDFKGNLIPGTVVDTGIVHPTIFDFFLCSHQGLKGTSKPTHYLLWFDDLGFTSDGIQELTNRLCYVYAACTRAVSIPAPAYYADLLAERARKLGIEDMRTALKPELARRVFYC